MNQKLPGPLMALLNQVSTAFEARDRISETARSSQTELDAVERQIDEIRTRGDEHLAHREASLALGETVSKAPSLVVGLDALEKQRAGLVARIRGLNTRRDTAVGELRALKSKFPALCTTLSQEMQNDLATEWHSAAQTLVGVAQRMALIEDTLTSYSHLTVRHLMELKLQDPHDPAAHKALHAWPRNTSGRVPLTSLPANADLAATLKPVLELKARLAGVE